MEINFDSLINKSPLEIKGGIFIKNISDRVDESLEYIETKYLQKLKFELAIDFISYHHSDAIKADMYQFETVGYFPATEAEMELDYSIKHALIGSYKSAFADLRRAIELTLTSVYLTSDQSNRKEAINWILSKSDTPFLSSMLKKLIKKGRYKDINDKHDWMNNLKQFYWNLSDYSHNRGQLKGYRELNKPGFFTAGTSAPTVNTDTLESFCDYYIQTVQEIIAMLALYNPMILVGVPLDTKFGLNPPASGFYYDHQAEIVHTLLPDRYKQYFLDIKENDEEVKSIVFWFDSQPDITEEDMKNQAIQLDEYYKQFRRD